MKAVAYAIRTDTQCSAYWVAHAKRTQLCNDVLLNSRIKGNNILKSMQAEQYEKLTTFCFCFNGEIRKRVSTYQVSTTYKITNKFIVQHVSLHEIDIQSQRLTEHVLNCASILLSNRNQSLFHCAMNFRTISMVFDSLFAVL